jgi:hypothetical protein
MSSRTKILIQQNFSNKESKISPIYLKDDLYKEPIASERRNKTVVISNVFGSFYKLYSSLIKYNVIDKDLHWTFDDGHLVIIGNCFDQNIAGSIECLWFIYGLEDKAIKHGGQVHFILGSNEIANLYGDWRFKHPNYAHVQHSSTALYDANNELHRWLLTKNIVKKLGGILFLHQSLIIKTIDKEIVYTDYDKPASFFRESFTCSNDEKLLNGLITYSSVREKCLETEYSSQLDILSNYFKAPRIVVGNFRQKTEVNVVHRENNILIHKKSIDKTANSLLIQDRRFYIRKNTGDLKRIM